MKIQSHISALAALTLLMGSMAQQSIIAKQGATDPIPGTSKGATNSGGKKSKTTTPAPTPAPTVTPIAAGPITFTAAGPINGSLPLCHGDYQVDPYYPTLLDMTLNVSVDSINVPDGTLLYINVVGVNGTLYPYTSNAIVVAGGVGFCSEKVFVTLGAGLAGVVITDSFGNAVFASN